MSPLEISTWLYIMDRLHHYKQKSVGSSVLAFSATSTQPRASLRRKLSNLATGCAPHKISLPPSGKKKLNRNIWKTLNPACKEIFLRVQKLPTFHSVRALSVLRCDWTGHLQWCCWSVPTKLSFLFEVSPFQEQFVWIKWAFQWINILLCSPLLKSLTQVVILTDISYHLVMYLVLKDCVWYLIHKFVFLLFSNQNKSPNNPLKPFWSY